MALIPIVTVKDGITPADVEVSQMTFKDLKLRETAVEEFIRKNTDRLFGEEETLLIVGQQVHNSSKGISDLIAIDEDGSLVLIEIKRDLDDIKNRREPFEFQAIRYAASCAKAKTPEELVDKVFVSYIEKHRSEFEIGQLTIRERGLRILYEFLSKNDALRTFNKTQRIILIASDFDTQTKSAVAWLIANGVDIGCFTLTPINTNGNYYLDVQRILPPTPLDDFFVDITGSTISRQVLTKKSITRTNLPRMKKLFEWGIIKKGDKLRIKNYDDSEAIVSDDKSIEIKGENMSYNEWGQKITGWSAICIYEWAIPIGKEKTLHELRISKMKELEKEQAASF